MERNDGHAHSLIDNQRKPNETPVCAPGSYLINVIFGCLPQTCESKFEESNWGWCSLCRNVLQCDINCGAYKCVSFSLFVRRKIYSVIYSSPAHWFRTRVSGYYRYRNTMMRVARVFQWGLQVRCTIRNQVRWKFSIFKKVCPKNGIFKNNQNHF